MKALASFAAVLVFAGATIAQQAVDQQPEVIKQQRPVYPYALRLSGNDGEVVVDFIVDEHGDVRNPTVLKSTHPEFEAPAVEAVLEWKFKPGRKDGQAVNTHMQAPIIFQLNGGNGWNRGVPAFEAPRKAPKSAPPELQYDEPPRPMLTSAPVYPIELLEKNITGSAAIAFLVDPQGVPRKMTVGEATRPEFGAAATAMIAAWRFVPAKKNGQPSWALLKIKQVFDRNDRDAPFNESAERLLQVMKKDPSLILGNLGELDARPKARFQPGPVLPENMKEKEDAAQAEIEFIIDRAGRAQLPRIVRASREDFGWAAATAVARWQFTAPTKNGKPADARVRIPIVFTPKKSEAP